GRAASAGGVPGGADVAQLRGTVAAARGHRAVGPVHGRPRELRDPH
ncbi:MAG: Endonuclease III, partial [uncultured Thermoleophilia bacterium]